MAMEYFSQYLELTFSAMNLLPTNIQLTTLREFVISLLQNKGEK